MRLIFSLSTTAPSAAPASTQFVAATVSAPSLAGSDVAWAQIVTLGLAAEFGPQGVSVNALWPRSIIATDAINMIPGVDPAQCRRPEIVADAAHAVLTSHGARYAGRFLTDEEVLRAAGVEAFDRYAVDPSRPLLPDLFLD